MLRNKPQAKPPPPVKPKRDTKHWSSRVQETVVSALPDEGLNVSLLGGADSGLFVYVGEVKHDKVRYHSGKLHPDEVILEIQGQKVAGYTLRDASIWLRQVSQNGAPVMIKSVKQGVIPVDLRLYLNTRFQKGSVDHDLQQTIRDNLYMRTVPCTTRPPRPGEINGVDYTFLSMEEFIELEKNGSLLEKGIYDGNNYGTPKPPKEPLNNQVRRTNSAGTLLPGSHPSSDGKRRRNRSNVESTSSAKSSPVPFGEDDFVPPPTASRKKSLERAHSISNLGPLPSNWEIAFTEDGQEYFIDHDTETTHWLDPRLANLQKKEPNDCQEDELPYGWEKVEDPHYGTYYIDHVNRRTQYENPVSSSKKTDDIASDGSGTFPRSKKNRSDSPKRTASDSYTNGLKSPPAYNNRKKPFFTKNPSELSGERIRTNLVKSTRGLGFTIIGGNEADQDFLQIKNVVENGPAFFDGRLKTGDVLVYVNGECVLGFTHQDVIAIFQGILPGTEVDLEVCRGYSLPFDPDDPDTEILTTVAVSRPHGPLNSNSPMYSSNRSGRSNSDRLNTSQRSMKSLPDLTRSAAGMHISTSHSDFSREVNHIDMVDNGDTPDVLGLANGKPETLSVNIVRGEMGFGFTIADSPYGQKVKQIIDRPRCKNLQEGDVLLEVNHNSVRDMSHSQVAQFLKECPIDTDTTILIQRGGPSGKSRKPSKTPRTPEDGRSKPVGDTSFSSAPGAYFFSGTDKDSQHGSNLSDKLDDSTVSTRSINSAHLDNHRSPQQPHMPAVCEDVSETTTDSSIFRGKTPSDSYNSSRPKTPNSMDSRSKTPTFMDNRPKTPTRFEGQKVVSPGLNRSQQMERLDKIVGEAHRPGKEFSPPRENGAPGMTFHRDGPNSRVDFSPPSSNMDHSTRPPPGPRGDGRWQDNNMRRPDYAYPKSNNAMHNFNDRRDHDPSSRFDRTDHARPGQFRSRTPGPEMMGRGPDYWPEAQRPKTPTAHDMRSKTPIPTSSNYAQNPSAIPDFIPSSRYNSYFNNSNHVNGPPTGYRPANNGRPRTPGGYNSGYSHPGSPYSSPPMRRPDGTYESPTYIQNDTRNYNNYSVNGPVDPVRGYSQGSPRGPVRPSRQSTSFETEEPTPSNITRVPRLLPPPSTHNPGNHSPFGFEDDRMIEMNVILPRQENGFGFRIIGGTEEGSQVSVGHIVPGGAADVDGRIRMHDEIVSVDGMAVLNQSHHKVVELMGEAAHKGRVALGLRRRIGGSVGPPPDVQLDSQIRGGNSIDNNYPYDVTVTRRETEGFGFVIISSVTKTGSTIGRILENSPAERCSRLHVGDRILAVNGRDIAGIHHEDIVNLIKDSGYSVTLTVGPPIDDASSTTSTSQRTDGHYEAPKSSQGSMINAMAYPAVSESDLSRRSDHSPAHYQGPMDRYPHPALGNERPKETPRHRHYGPPDVEEEEDQFYSVEFHRGSRGFGFSIRGGQEFNNMPLFVLRIAEGGAADLDGRLRVGDQILDINGYNTDNMTHADAISLIQSGGSHVRMHVKRTGKPPPNYGKGAPPPNVGRLPPGVPMSNGPIGHSSPHVMRRGAEREDYYYGNNYGQPRHPPQPPARPYPNY